MKYTSIEENEVISLLIEKKYEHNKAFVSESLSSEEEFELYVFRSEPRRTIAPLEVSAKASIRQVTCGSLNLLATASAARIYISCTSANKTSFSQQLGTVWLCMHILHTLLILIYNVGKQSLERLIRL